MHFVSFFAIFISLTFIFHDILEIFSMSTVTKICEINSPTRMTKLESQHYFIAVLGAWGIALPIMHTKKRQFTAYIPLSYTYS